MLTADPSIYPSKLPPTSSIPQIVRIGTAQRAVAAGRRRVTDQAVRVRYGGVHNAWCARACKGTPMPAAQSADAWGRCFLP